QDSTGGSFTATGLLDKLYFTANRDTNVVTLAVRAGHNVVAGDALQILDAVDASFNGSFTDTSVTQTNIVYNQTAANGSTTGSAFSVNHNFPYWMKVRLVGPDFWVKVWRYGQDESDWGDTTRAGKITWTPGGSPSVPMPAGQG